jgi:hypothetical protein
MVDIPVPSQADFDNLFASIKRGIDGMIAMAASLSTEGLAKAQAIAVASLSIFTAIKSAVESLGALRDYKGVTQETIDTLLSDFQRAIDLLKLMDAGMDDFVKWAESFEAKAVRGAEALARALAKLGVWRGAGVN